MHACTETTDVVNDILATLLQFYRSDYSIVLIASGLKMQTPSCYCGCSVLSFFFLFRFLPKSALWKQARSNCNFSTMCRMVSITFPIRSRLFLVDLRSKNYSLFNILFRQPVWQTSTRLATNAVMANPYLPRVTPKHCSDAVYTLKL